MGAAPFGLVLHGGAGARVGGDYSRQLAHMRSLVEDARHQLHAGGRAVDVDAQVVAAM